MPRFFFDVHDSDLLRDAEGQELPEVSAVRKIAMEALPKIAADEIPEDGDRQNFVVVVRDEAGHAVYTATLSYVGLRLPDPTST